MAAYEDLDQCAADALELCELVRQCDPKQMYRHLAVQCYRDPERLAQMLMTLAVFVDPDAATTGGLRRIIAAVTVEQHLAAGAVR